MIFFSGEKKYDKIFGVFWKLIHSKIEKFNELHDTQQIFVTGRRSIRDSESVDIRTMQKSYVELRGWQLN